jgi:anti-sigma factor RsiW
VSGAEFPVSEEDLHAYVDGQLPAERRACIERYLAAHPEPARRVNAYAAQRRALRDALAGVAGEPVPPELNLARLVEARLRPRRAPWAAAAALALAFGLGGTGGWMVAERPWEGAGDRTALAMRVLEQQALASHAVYAADLLHPVEMSGDARAPLEKWLSARLARPVVAPDLDAVGLRLIGGRLLATERGGAAALLLYEDAAGTRMSVLLRPMARELAARETDTSRGEANLCLWIADGMGYALVGRLPEADLDRIAGQIRNAQASG